MLAWRDGEEAAFEALYARHRARLFRYLLHQCGKREQADEMFQEIWMSVMRARGGYEVSAKFTTWLYRIAHNRVIDGFRARGRLAEFEVDAGDGGHCPTIRRLRTSNRNACSNARNWPAACWPPSGRCRRRSAKPSCWRSRAA